MRLAAADLTLERGGRRIFSHLSFAIENGQALAVTGANGAGKSSLLRALAGLVRPVAGSITLTPKSPAMPESELSLCEAMHYVGPAEGLKNMLTLSENLSFWGAMLAINKENHSHLEDALARFGLSGVAQLPALYLSAGQRRRAALARLLLAPRPIWLLDEPLNALDTASQNLLREIMREHQAGGGLIVAATHASLGLESFELKIGAPA
jgi:heme exporter protein A